MKTPLPLKYKKKVYQEYFNLVRKVMPKEMSRYVIDKAIKSHLEEFYIFVGEQPRKKIKKL
jgi:hypothetical protein